MNKLRFIDFQNNLFIVTVLYSMVTIWKRFLQTRLNHWYSYDKIQDIWKSSLFSKKATLTIKWKNRSICILIIVNKFFSFFINLSPSKDLFLLKRNLSLRNKVLDLNVSTKASNSKDQLANRNFSLLKN